MKGIVTNIKTGETKEADDGLPMPEFPPYTEPAGIALAEVTQKLKEIDQLKADVEELKTSKSPP